jgi:glycosyltransferase involved in cell wall biosynthesis
LASSLAVPAVATEVLRGAAHLMVTWGDNAHAVGALVSRLTRTPQALNWHRPQRPPMTRKARSIVSTAATAGANAIAVTGAQVDDLRRLGFPQQRIRVVSNGVLRPRSAARSQDEMRAELGFDRESFVAAYVGRLHSLKRVEDFIDAVALAAGSTPAIRGVVVGDGPLEAELRERARATGSPVSFVGFQHDPSRYLRASDVVCLTSEMEALPMALIEGAACGRPAVATDVGGIGEIVCPGETGLLVPARDVAGVATALVQLALDPLLRERMGRKAAARWQRQYSFEAMVDGYAREFSELQRTRPALRAA